MTANEEYNKDNYIVRILFSPDLPKNRLSLTVLPTCACIYLAQPNKLYTPKLAKALSYNNKKIRKLHPTECLAFPYRSHLPLEKSNNCRPSSEYSDDTGHNIALLFYSGPYLVFMHSTVEFNLIQRNRTRVMIEFHLCIKKKFKKLHWVVF